MDIITLTSFEDELEKIADSAGGMLVKKVLPTVAPKIRPVTMADTPHGKALAELFKKSPSWGKKVTASVKTSGAGAAIGTIGAGLTALHGGLKEWDRRASENQALSRMTPEQQGLYRPGIDQARKHRLKRLAVNTALAGAAGGLVGHYGSKAAVHLTDAMSKKLTENLKPASEHAADVLGKGFSKGMAEGGAQVVDKAKGESKGFLGRLFFGKK